MKYLIAILFFIFIFFSLESYSQDTLAIKKTKLHRNFLVNEGKWKIEIPVWIPGFRGELSYGNIKLGGSDGDVPPGIDQPIEKPRPGDIFKRLFNSNGNLNFFFMSSISFTSNNFLVFTDGFSGSAGQSILFRYNDKEFVNAKFTANLYRLYTGYKIADIWSKSAKTNFRFYPYAGVRFHDISVQTQVLDLVDIEKLNPIWAEAIIGVRNELLLKRWKFLINGDIGFLGKNSKVSYMIGLSAYFRISNLISVKAGWSDWDTNYKGTYKDEELKLFMHLSGPATSIAFHF